MLCAKIPSSFNNLPFFSNVFNCCFHTHTHRVSPCVTQSLIYIFLARVEGRRLTFLSHLSLCVLFQYKSNTMWRNLVMPASQMLAGLCSWRKGFGVVTSLQAQFAGHYQKCGVCHINVLKSYFPRGCPSLIVRVALIGQRLPML